VLLVLGCTGAVSSVDDAGVLDAGAPASGGGATGGGSGGGATGGGGELDAGSCLACTDFETGTPTVVQPNCSGAGTASVESGVSHSGTHALHVHGVAGYCNHVFVSFTPALPSKFWVRFWVRAHTALGDGHLTFLAMKDHADGDHDFRMGAQSRILMFNRESDDATLPALSPQGIALSRTLTPDTWTCVELEVDQAAGTFSTSLDGALVSGLVRDASSTPDVDEQWARKAWLPSLVDLRLGFESYAGENNELWFDDVRVSETRPGCP
jgi:hypothetical protein